MHDKAVIEHARTKLGAIEDYPFGPDVMVMKVGGKMFALFALRDGILQMSLKCKPEYGEILRQHHPEVTPGYHLNKRHWNTVAVTSALSRRDLEEWIDHSYELVFSSLTRAAKKELAPKSGTE